MSLGRNRSSTLYGGMIGVGTWSAGQLEAWRRVSGANIIAACDVDEDRLHTIADRFEITHRFTSARAMLDEIRLDFVDICTRPAAHLSLVRVAADRGLAILCQKPFCGTDLSEAREAIAYAAAKGAPLMINENYRWQAWYRTARELIDKGEIGQPFIALLRKRARITLPRFEHRQTYLKEMPELVGVEVGVHYFDVLRFLLGEADLHYGISRRIGPDICGEDVLISMTSFGSATGILCVSWASHDPLDIGLQNRNFAPELQIDGTGGTLALFGDGRMTLRNDTHTREWVFGPNILPDSQFRTQQHFVDCLATGGRFETDGEDTLRTMELVRAFYESASRHQAIPL